ncbi:MAG: ATP-binding protein [Deltaproteobacteria bacterium]|nr:ATP-binding protein [Deltaproteobacteria bacterium]
MIARNITDGILESLSDSPVVLLVGARQVGKSTLAQKIASDHHQARYLTLDDAVILSAARSDAAGFLSGLEGPVVLDEVQRAPELFPAIKASVDRDRKSGRFLLTGSADVMLLPKVSESLAGRMEIHTLWPFSQGELSGVKESFIDLLFMESKRYPEVPGPENRDRDIAGRIVTGGYPEIIKRTGESRRRSWYGSYITTILQRDIRELANIEGLTDLPRILSLLAARASSLLNYAELSRSSGLPQSTFKRYMALLEAAFLVRRIPSWSGNLSKRLVRSPKLFLNDTGLAAYLMGLNRAGLSANKTIFGPLLENFVVMELMKQTAWSEASPGIYHFRSQTGQEVDVVLEARDGTCVGVEVKASRTVGAGDFRGLKALAELLGPKFVRGVILYTGKETVPFAENMHAVPVDSLFRGEAGREMGGISNVR